MRSHCLVSVIDSKLCKAFVSSKGFLVPRSLPLMPIRMTVSKCASMN
jgi:hypothetical protein